MASAPQNREKVEPVVNKHNISIMNNLPYEMFKRLVDVIGASIGLIILSVLFVIVSIAIKIEDPKGPIFFLKIE